MLIRCFSLEKIPYVLVFYKCLIFQYLSNFPAGVPLSTMWSRYQIFNFPPAKPDNSQIIFHQNCLINCLSCSNLFALLAPVIFHFFLCLENIQDLDNIVYTCRKKKIAQCHIENFWKFASKDRLYQTNSCFDNLTCPQSICASVFTLKVTDSPSVESRLMCPISRPTWWYC